MFCRASYQTLIACTCRTMQIRFFISYYFFTEETLLNNTFNCMLFEHAKVANMGLISTSISHTLIVHVELCRSDSLIFFLYRANIVKQCFNIKLMQFRLLTSHFRSISLAWLSVGMFFAPPRKSCCNSNNQNHHTM